MSHAEILAQMAAVLADVAREFKESLMEDGPSDPDDAGAGSSPLSSNSDLAYIETSFLSHMQLVGTFTPVEDGEWMDGDTRETGTRAADEELMEKGADTPSSNQGSSNPGYE
jgi:hypothetical protein